MIRHISARPTGKLESPTPVELEPASSARALVGLWPRAKLANHDETVSF